MIGESYRLAARRPNAKVAPRIGSKALLPLVFTAAACSPVVEHADTPSTNMVAPVIELTPDMSGFLQNPTTCLNGGARPCAPQLRVRPALSSSIINADPQVGGRITWPEEPYGGQPGDPVQVDCFTTGETVRDYDGHTSPYWYKVRVPADRVANPEVQPELAGRDWLLGFSVLVWFGEEAPSEGVPQC